MISTDEQDSIESESEIGKVAHKAQRHNESFFDYYSQELDEDVLSYANANNVYNNTAIANPREHVYDENDYVEKWDDAKVFELFESLENVGVFFTSNDVDYKWVG